MTVTSAKASQQSLETKQKSIIPIAAFTAKGNTTKLKEYLVQGLDNGMTINEIKEVLIQMYAYTGFPRSLTALNTFMAVLEERKTQGIEDTIGKDATPIPQGTNMRELGTKIQTEVAGRKISGPLYDFVPTIDIFLKEHLFGDIFARDVLNFKEREIATISALASLPAADQLRSHYNVSLNVGLTKAQLEEFVHVMNTTVGTTEGTLAKKILHEVLQAHQ